MEPKTETAVFANGCFWCTEAVFSRLKGVISVNSGYTGGRTEKPTYDAVCNGNTGHAEAVRIEFNPSIITYDDLLTVFFFTHNPTTLNRQGNDVGTQYRSEIFYATPEQEQSAKNFIEKLEQEDAYDSPIVTAVSPLTQFYPAEEYHREYYKNNKTAPYCELIITPKIEALERRFAALIAR